MPTVSFSPRENSGTFYLAGRLRNKSMAGATKLKAVDSQQLHTGRSPKFKERVNPMLRSVFSFASIFLLLIPTLFLPAPTAAARYCPDEPPKTLLSLYRTSDSIHIGRYDRFEEGTIIEDTDDYTVVEIKKHFSISSTIKGEPRKFFTLEEKDYRYKNDDESDHAEDGEEGEYGDLYMPKVEPGDNVVLFLRKGEGEDQSPILTDWSGSLKKVTKDELDSYERRLNELNAIFGRKKVSDEEIVRWIVDTARDPNTRWEGSFELLQSFQSADWKKQREAQIAEMKKNGETVAEEDIESGEPDTSVYSTLLTQAQKADLMNLVLEARPDSENPVTLRQKRGDGALIDLVTHWGDSRFAKFLVDRLRNSSAENHYERLDLMSKIADILKDEELSLISSKFSDVTYQEDDAVVGDGGEPENTGQEGGVAAGEPTGSTPKVTYRELRGDLIGQFLSRSDAVVAKENNRQAARVINN